MRRIYNNTKFSLTPDQIAAIRSFKSTSSLVHNIHGLAGTGKSTIIATIIGLAAKLGFRFVVTAVEYFTLNNAVEDMCSIVTSLSKDKETEDKTVIRWYARKDLKLFLNWAIRNRDPLPAYSELLQVDPSQLTELDHLRLCMGQELQFGPWCCRWEVHGSTAQSGILYSEG